MTNWCQCWMYSDRILEFAPIWNVNIGRTSWHLFQCVRGSLTTTKERCSLLTSPTATLKTRTARTALATRSCNQGTITSSTSPPLIWNLPWTDPVSMTMWRWVFEMSNVLICVHLTTLLFLLWMVFLNKAEVRFYICVIYIHNGCYWELTNKIRETI